MLYVWESRATGGLLWGLCHGNSTPFVISIGAIWHFAENLSIQPGGEDPVAIAPWVRYRSNLTIAMEHLGLTADHKAESILDTILKSVDTIRNNGMKKIVTILILFFSAITIYAQTTVTILADDGYFPYSYAEGTVPKGAYVDIITNAAAKLNGYKVEITPIPWKRGLSKMENGEAFALFPPYKRPGLRPWMDYVLKLYDEKMVLLLNKNASIPATAVWPKDFVGKAIAQNAGWIVLAPWKNQVKIVDSFSTTTAIKQLEVKHVDAFIADEIAVLATVKTLKTSGALSAESKFIVGPTVSTEEAFLCLSNVAETKTKYPYKDDFSKQMKVILDTMRKSGEIQKIVKKYTE